MNSINPNGPSGHLTPPMTSRKRKRAHQYTVSYSEVQEVDSDGRLREVIVIEDTPPPTISPSTTHNVLYSASYQPPVYNAPIRTRARAAAEAQALSASSSSVLTAPAPKKRKRDLLEEVRAPVAKRPAIGNLQSHTVVGPNSTQTRTGADDVGLFRSLTLPWFLLILHTFLSQQGRVPWDDKEGHYIIVPDDMIHSRCMCRIFRPVAFLILILTDRTVRLLGQGTFGKVVEAVDTHENKRVAIKIIRAIQKYRDASRIEVRVLQKLKERDPMNRK